MKHSKTALIFTLLAGMFSMNSAYAWNQHHVVSPLHHFIDDLYAPYTAPGHHSYYYVPATPVYILPHYAH